ARTTGASTHAATAQVAGRDAETIRVKEERLHAEKRPVETGEVTVRKEVHTENKTLEVPVQREKVVIERTPVHGHAATEGVAAGDDPDPVHLCPANRVGALERGDTGEIGGEALHHELDLHLSAPGDVIPYAAMSETS